MHLTAPAKLRGTCLLALVLASATHSITAASADQSGGLEEIIVTAERRSERLSDVPESVRAFSQEDMEKLGLKNVDDLTRVTPGVTFLRTGVSASSNYNDQNSTLSIRGVSSNTGAPTTAVYIDDTPIQTRGLAYGPAPFPALFDLERAEVLKGPQGTLFGASAMGGAIRFVTPDASLKDFSGYASAEFGDIRSGGQNYEAGAAFGGPIIDGVLGFRVSASTRKEGGWVDRVDYQRPPSAVSPSGATLYAAAPSVTSTTEPNSNWHDTQTFRAALKWQPIDQLTVDPSIFIQTLHINDTSAYWENISSPADAVYNNGNADRNASTDPWYVAAVKVNWRLPWADINSNTSYFARNQHAVSDYTQWVDTVFLSNQYPAPGAHSPSVFSDSSRNFTQEIRINSTDADATFQWSGGLYYSRMHERGTQTLYSQDLQIFGAVPPDYFTYFQDVSSIDKQAAAFGELTVKLATALSATAGLRYSKVDVDSVAGSSGPLSGNPDFTPVVLSTTSKPLTPRFVLKYHPGDSLYYISASKGFRPGIPQLPLPDTVATQCGTQAPGNVKPDSLWQYEIGSKNTLLNGRLQLDGALYYLKWKDIQQAVYLPSCGAAFTDNLGVAVGRGGELTVMWRATDELTLGLTGAYTTTYYEDATSLKGLTGNFTAARQGDHLPASPWNADLNAEYIWNVARWNPYLRADYQFASAQHSLTPLLDSGNAPNADPSLPGLPEIRILTLRAGLRIQGFDVSVFAQNALDFRTPIVVSRDEATTALNGFADNFATNYFARGYAPRTIGLTVAYRF